MTTAIKPKRRFLRFSLRTLLVVMLVVCMVLGTKVQQVRQKRAAVAWVLASGGVVNYEHNYFNPYTEPAGPKFLRKVLGDDFFADVYRVRITNQNISDLTPLAGLASLTLLQVSGTQVDDLTPLGHLKSLTLLHLNGTNVSDLAPLAGLTKLESLHLSATQVTDLTALAELPQLTELHVDETKVNDVTLLAGLTSLLEMKLGNTPLSKEDYETLQKALPNCTIHWSPAAESP